MINEQAMPSPWIRIVSPVVALVGLWIACFSAVTVHRAWYFAIYADEYVSAEFVIDSVVVSNPISGHRRSR